MTYTPAELELSPEAAARLDDYLRQVRAALAGTGDVNPDEIEADIREHVGNELSAAPRPVALSALDAVLTKLGPPAQWGTTDDPTLFRRARHLLGESLRAARAGAVERAKRVRFTLWHGPDDWRLAYLSFGVFALGALTMVVFPIALLVSYFLSRAGLAVANEKGIALGAGRKWLLYPPVVIVSAILLVAVIAWPVALGGWVGSEVAGAAHRVEYFERDNPVPRAGAGPRELREWHDRLLAKDRMALQVEEDRKLLATVPGRSEFKPVAAGLFVGVGAAALWWTILGAAAARFPRAVRATFCPLCDRFERRHGLWLAVACFVVALAWCATAYQVVAALV